MFLTNAAHRGPLNEQHGATEALERVGRIAGVLAVAVLVFSSLYFFVLYIASE
jgi:hypothetical protein